MAAKPALLAGGNLRIANEGEEVDAVAFKTLVLQAVALNGASKAKPVKKVPHAH